MRLRRVMIAATGSGSGKTTITCALLRAWKDMGEQVVAYKCGPDYIDPMFHETVMGIPSKNLDTFFTNENQTQDLFLKERTEKDLVVMEGVMGLYDGLGGIREEGSSYHLAKVTQTPILLVINAKGMGRSLLPLIAGFLAYDKERLIKGVLLNRMTSSFYQIMKPLIEDELGISVLGYMPENQDLIVESRHLGLHMPTELGNREQQLQTAAMELRKTVSLEKILRIAEGAKQIGRQSIKEEYHPSVVAKKTRLAVAKDAAFCFYYKDNLDMLCAYGAELCFFSPLQDKELPRGCSGILLGGGYPELYAKELSENRNMQQAIRSALSDGMPVVAECGGFMYLHQTIIEAGIAYPMVGVIPHSCQNNGKLVRFGYIEIEESKNQFLSKGERIRGHEFHYFDSANAQELDAGKDCLARKPMTGKTYPCIMVGENYWFGYPHLYYPSNPSFPQRFMEKAKKYEEERDGTFTLLF